MSEVYKWVGHVDVLAGVAVTQPQLAYAALSRSLQHEQNFLLRVVPQCSQLFQELEISLFSRFLPAMFGVEVSAVEHLFALPLQLGNVDVPLEQFNEYIEFDCLHTLECVVRAVLSTMYFKMF